MAEDPVVILGDMVRHSFGGLPDGWTMTGTLDGFGGDVVTLPAHVCKTYDGVPITLGLRVKDYDCKIGVVVEAPSKWQLDDSVCWPQIGHGGHWWGVCPDRDGHVHDEHCRGGSFDGSRLLARGSW